MYEIPEALRKELKSKGPPPENWLIYLDRIKEIALFVLSTIRGCNEHIDRVKRMRLYNKEYYKTIISTYVLIEDFLESLDPQKFEEPYKKVLNELLSNAKTAFYSHYNFCKDCCKRQYKVSHKGFLENF